MNRPTRDTSSIRFAKLVERGIVAFTYTYDFGDDGGTTSRSKV